LPSGLDSQTVERDRWREVRHEILHTTNLLGLRRALDLLVHAKHIQFRAGSISVPTFGGETIEHQGIPPTNRSRSCPLNSDATDVPRNFARNYLKRRFGGS